MAHTQLVSVTLNISYVGPVHNPSIAGRVWRRDPQPSGGGDTRTSVAVCAGSRGVSGRRGALSTRYFVPRRSECPVLGGSWWLCRRRARVGEERVNGGHELAQRERLGQEHVGPGPKGGIPVLGIGPCADDDHAAVPTPRAEMTAHLDPAGMGNDDIEHDHVGALAEDGPQGLVPRGSTVTLVTVVLQCSDEEAEQVGLVLDHQHSAPR